ncbi:MAG TPA: DnaJ domain-containing protein [Casimicrobiaceae bacterium]|nr:DnaJ domain-containing protein [Casimicrobiaceae bacterium]
MSVNTLAKATSGVGAWHGLRKPICKRGPQVIASPDRMMSMIYTHYDYLEIAPGTPRERIEAAYARVLERFNDAMTPNGPDLSTLVRMIHSAYQVLSDQERRIAYDAQLAIEADQADAELKQILDMKSPLPRRVQDVPEPLNSAVTALAA